MANESDEGYNKHELIKHLIASIPCAICQHRYEANDVQIVDHRDEIWVMAVKCNHCGTQGLIFAMIKEGEKPEIVSELTARERARFREMPQIDADDLLDVHEFLRDFEGDVVSLLEA